MARKPKPDDDTDDASVARLVPIRIAELDRRTVEYKRYSSIVDAIVSDLGGPSAIGEAKRQLVGRFAMLSLWAEIMETAALAGQAFDVEAHGRVSGHLSRLGDKLGLDRATKTVESLSDYLAAKRGVGP